MIEHGQGGQDEGPGCRPRARARRGRAARQEGLLGPGSGRRTAPGRWTRPGIPMPAPPGRSGARTTPRPRMLARRAGRSRRRRSCRRREAPRPASHLGSERFPDDLRG
jgi:hypothetical protein